MIIYIQWVIWIDLSYLDCKGWSVPRCIQWVIISSLTQIAMIQKKHQFRWNHQTSPSVFSWGPSPDGPPDGPPGLSRTSFGSSAPCPNLEPNSAHQCRRDRDFRLNGLRQKICWRTVKLLTWNDVYVGNQMRSTKSTECFLGVPESFSGVTLVILFTYKPRPRLTKRDTWVKVFSQISHVGMPDNHQIWS